jgi:predicted dehydrogenase
MTSFGIGLIGLGRHGMRYARHLLEPLPRARLVAVSRRDAVQGKAFAAEHGVRFYQDYRDLIADTDIRAIIVVTPPSLAHPICLEAVRVGKPALIEKPLACTGTEAREMVRAADSAGIPLMTAQTLRFNEAILAFKAKLDTVAPRRYLTMAAHIELHPGLGKDSQDYGGRGVLLEIGIHLLDLVRFLTGEEVAEVRCGVEPRGSGTPELRALVDLRTTGNMPCTLDVSRVNAGRIGRGEWIGEHGRLTVDWVRHRLCRMSSGLAVEEWNVPDRPTVAATIHAFLEALELGTPMPITGKDGQKAVELADACYESAETGQYVRLVG